MESLRVLEESSPLISHNTNHSFILTDYTKSYSCPDFNINPTWFLFKCPASHVSHLKLVGRQLWLGELLPAAQLVYIFTSSFDEVNMVQGEKALGLRCKLRGQVGFLSLHFPFLSGQFNARSPFYQGGEEGKTWDRKGMLSTGLMAMFSGPAIFIGMGVVIATGWAIFMGAVAGMLTEAMLTGPVMVTGCWRLTGDVMLTVLVLMFICAAMVTGLLLLELPRFIAVVMGAETVTGVAEAELQISLPSAKTPEKGFNFSSAAT